MTQASIGQDDANRLAAITRFEILDTPPEAAFDRITALAARLLRAPIATMSVVDLDRVWFKSRHGTELAEVASEPGLCASAVLQSGVWVVEDAALDARTRSHPLVAGPFGLRFYAGAPLRVGDGLNLGVLSIMDVEPRRLSRAQGRLLTDLASIVVRELDIRLEARQAMRESPQLRARYGGSAFEGGRRQAE
jgi:eukaryotic-like serine/threonine-protein kinase